MTSKPTVLEFRQVTKAYPSGEETVYALRQVSFCLKRGEFATLSGPSGSGKSTLLNLAGCLDRPTSGEVFIDGIDTSKMSAAELAQLRNRKIGFVFQQYNLLPRISAQRNVALPMFYGRIPPDRRRARALELLKAVGLGHRATHTPTQLSGGECQRVAIARALAMTPSILLADEPTGNLDSKRGQEIIDIFKRLHAQGNTILMVTHSPELAELGTVKLKMKDGMLHHGS